MEVLCAFLLVIRHMFISLKKKKWLEAGDRGLPEVPTGAHGNGNVQETSGPPNTDGMSEHLGPSGTFRVFFSAWFCPSNCAVGLGLQSPIGRLILLWEVFLCQSFLGCFLLLLVFL